MPFLKELRRRSRSSFRSNSNNTSSSEYHSAKNGDMPQAVSSSTIDSSSSSNTPPSTVNPSLPSSRTSIMSNSNGNIASTPGTPKPRSIAPQSARNSVIGANSLSANGTSRTPPTSTSPFSPRVHSVSDNSWVHQKVLLVYGEVGDSRQHSLDGTLTIFHCHDAFPPVSWPVYDSHFKALVQLGPGPNKLRFDFTSSKLATGGFPPPVHSTHLSINCLPLSNSPPLDLVVLLGKDSNGTFDAVPERIAREGNDLDRAMRKFRMAAYLWQAFTGEQMFRNQFGRRCFRFEEEWQTGTLSRRDTNSGVMRSEAKVHVVRCDKTVAELRNFQSQEDGPAGDKEGLFDIAKKAVRDHFKPQPGQQRYVSVLLLDTHWDNATQKITGHTAQGSAEDDIKLSIFGSQNLQSYPSCIEEVIGAFTDCTRTDTSHVTNDNNESGSSWEAASMGIGAHLHEIGHLFGCPQQEDGIMLRDYVRFNRTFTVRESYSTRVKAPGLRLCTSPDESKWHRLDTLRFRFHPCFRLATDPPPNPDTSIQVWPVENGKIMLTAASGIAFIELYAEGDDACKSFIEYVGSEGGNSGAPRQVTVSESELRQQLPDKKRSKKLRVEIYSGCLSRHTISDISLLKAKRSTVKLPNGQTGYKGNKLGSASVEGSKEEQLILECAFIQTKLLTSIKIHHGSAVQGIEFCYEDSTSQLFGNKDGTEKNEFVFDTRRGEILLGFYVRLGSCIEGIEVLTSLGRKSGVFGKSKAGTGHTLMPPRGYSVAGVTGSHGSRLDSLSLIITR
ncbi:hypothetical protein FQN54_007211 [Arachnomyces sp. PD_36]|nr:hypothetical protein FQN54_007211 [Arachnomyces sp. PD_36]